MREACAGVGGAVQAVRARAGPGGAMTAELTSEVVAEIRALFEETGGA